MVATVLARHHVEEELKREPELVQPLSHMGAVTIVKDRIHKLNPATMLHATNVSIRVLLGGPPEILIYYRSKVFT